MQKIFRIILSIFFMFMISACSKSKIPFVNTNNLNIAKYVEENIQNWNIHQTNNENDHSILTNLEDSLLTYNAKGKIISCLASDWDVNQENHTWIFHLRNDAYWVDYKGNVKGNVTAADFITGLSYVLNPENQCDVDLPIHLVQGAKEYYDLANNEYLATGFVSEETKNQFRNMVGIEAIDEFTLQYHTVGDVPYFDIFATYNSFYPLSANALKEFQGEYGKDEKHIYYSGPYVVSKNKKDSMRLKKNESWYDTSTRFDTINIKLVNDQKEAYQLFKKGKIDATPLTIDDTLAILKNPDHKYYDYVVETRIPFFSKQLVFQTKDENWNKAIQNEAFRMCFKEAVNYTKFLNEINLLQSSYFNVDTLSCANYIYLSNRKDYNELVRENMNYIDGYNHYDSSKKEVLIQEAKNELLKLDIPLPIPCTLLDCYGATTLQAVLNDYLGELITVEIGNEEASLAIQSVKLNYKDLVLDHDILTNDPVLKQLIQNAIDSGSLDDRYEKLANVESYYLQHAYSIPLCIDVSYQITKIDDYSIKKKIYGDHSNRYVDVTTKDQNYKTQQYESSKL